jgi:hypothetical protein
MSLVIGLGTGRCGSHTLHEMFAIQEDSFFTHEFGDKPILHWNSKVKPNNLFHDHIQSKKRMFGDVGFYHLPHCREYISSFPDVKFVILKREREETIRSFEKKATFRNHWMHGHGKFKPCPWGWDPCFPKYSATNRREAIGMYYDDYYNQCMRLDQKRCYWIPMQDLNDKDLVLDMLEWCGFKNQKFFHIHSNKS